MVSLSVCRPPCRARLSFIICYMHGSSMGLMVAAAAKGVTHVPQNHPIDAELLEINIEYRSTILVAGLHQAF